MTNKVVYGLDKVHVAFFDEDAPSQPAWETPIAIPGAVRFTPTAEGDESTFYADNLPYFTTAVNNGYSAELEMALVPDAVIARMLGWRIDSNGMLVENADGVQESFALLFQVMGDKKNRRNVYYNCKASRPAKEQSTKAETIEPNPDILSLKIIPLVIDDVAVIKGTIELNDTNATVFNGFFDAVLKPQAAQ